MSFDPLQHMKIALASSYGFLHSGFHFITTKVLPCTKRRHDLFISSRSGKQARTQVPTTRNCTVELPTFWGNRRGQRILTAMDGPHSGRITLMIIMSSLSGKYEFTLTKIWLPYSQPIRSGSGNRTGAVHRKMRKYSIFKV